MSLLDQFSHCLVPFHQSLYQMLSAKSLLLRDRATFVATDGFTCHGMYHRHGNLLEIKSCHGRSSGAKLGRGVNVERFGPDTVGEEIYGLFTYDVV